MDNHKDLQPQASSKASPKPTFSFQPSEDLSIGKEVIHKRDKYTVYTARRTLGRPHKQSRKKVFVDSDSSESSGSAPPSPEHLSEQVQAVLCPEVKRDTTVHFELDVGLDLEDHLEELNRLKRIGHFREAEEYVQSYLQDYLHVPVVAFEYSDLLLEQGAYQRFSTLCSQKILRRPQRGDNPMDILCFCYDLIEILCEMSSVGLTSKHIRNLKQSPTYFVIEKDADPLELQLIRRKLLIRAAIVNEDNDENLGGSHDYWTMVHKSLLSSGRVWDMRDIFCALISCYGPEKAWTLLLDKELGSHTIGDFVESWTLGGYDVSTYLALIDVLTTLVHEIYTQIKSLSDRIKIPTGKQLSDYTQHLSNTVHVNSPTYIKSRPLIRWAVIKVQFMRAMADIDANTHGRKPGPSFLYFAQFPGTVPPAKNNILFYCPRQSENPGWPAPNPCAQGKESIEIALQTSRELGDYETEAMCLGELMYHVPDPREVLEKMLHLRKTIQADILGYRQTRLLKYLFATDDESRRSLSKELEASQHDSFTMEHYHATRRYELRVQSALYFSLNEISKWDKTRQDEKLLVEKLHKPVPSSLTNIQISGPDWPRASLYDNPHDVATEWREVPYRRELERESPDRCLYGYEERVPRMSIERDDKSKTRVHKEPTSIDIIRSHRRPETNPTESGSMRLPPEDKTKKPRFTEVADYESSEEEKELATAKIIVGGDKDKTVAETANLLQIADSDSID